MHLENKFIIVVRQSNAPRKNLQQVFHRMAQRLLVLACQLWFVFGFFVVALAQPGTITTIVGMGVAGFAGDGGPATAAKINSPRGVAMDGAGNLYIADFNNHRIRKVDPSGNITTVAGTGTAGFSGDGGPAIAARLNTPSGVVVDGAGNLYIADDSNHRVRKVDIGGIITTIAGTGVAGFSGDGGPATAARLNFPNEVEVDAAGTLYISDQGNHRIGCITCFLRTVQKFSFETGGRRFRYTSHNATPGYHWLVRHTTMPLSV